MALIMLLSCIVMAHTKTDDLLTLTSLQNSTWLFLEHNEEFLLLKSL